MKISFSHIDDSDKIGSFEKIDQDVIDRSKISELSILGSNFPFTDYLIPALSHKLKVLDITQARITLLPEIKLYQLESLSIYDFSNLRHFLCNASTLK